MNINKKLKINKITLLFLILISTLLLFHISFNSNLFKTYISLYEQNNGVITHIDSTKKISQEFFAKIKKMNAIEFRVKLDSKKYKNEKLGIVLYDDSENIVFKQKILLSKIKDCEYMKFRFPVVENAEFQKFKLELSCIDCTANKGFSVLGIRQQNKNETAKLNDKSINYSMTLRHHGLLYNYGLIIILFSINMILIGIYFYNYLLKKFIVNKYTNVISLVLEFVLIIVFCFALYKYIYIHAYMLNSSLIYFLILFMLGILITSISIYRIYYYKKISQIFLTLMLIIGLPFLVFIIPGQVADENVHYYTSYSIFNGNLLDLESIVDGPKQLNDYDRYKLKNYADLNEIIDMNNNKFTVKATTSGYPSIFYLPSSVGIKLSETLNFPLFLGFYIGRLFNFITFLIIAFIALEIIPFGKYLLFVYMFNPMFIHQVISLSCDGLMNMFTILYFSLLLKLLKEKKNGKHYCKQSINSLVILSIIVALSKYVYLPIVFLNFLLLKKDDLKTNKKIIVTIIFSVLLCLILFIYSVFFKSGEGAVTVVETTGIDIFGQLRYLFSDMFAIFNVGYNTLKNFGDYYVMTTFGNKLGWLDIIINPLIIYAYFIILIISIFVDTKDSFLEKKDIRIMRFISILIFLLVVYGMYLTWTPVGAIYSTGVQGRYFLQFLFIFLTTFINKKNLIRITNYEVKMSIYLCLINLFVIGTIISNFI